MRNKGVHKCPEEFRDRQGEKIPLSNIQGQETDRDGYEGCELGF